MPSRSPNQRRPSSASAANNTDMNPTSNSEASRRGSRNSFRTYETDNDEGQETPASTPRSRARIEHQATSQLRSQAADHGVLPSRNRVLPPPRGAHVMGPPTASAEAGPSTAPASSSTLQSGQSYIFGPEANPDKDFIPHESSAYTVRWADAPEPTNLENAGNHWTPAQDVALLEMRGRQVPYTTISQTFGKTPLACRLHHFQLNQRARRVRSPRNRRAGRRSSSPCTRTVTPRSPRTNLRKYRKRSNSAQGCASGCGEGSGQASAPTCDQDGDVDVERRPTPLVAPQPVSVLRGREGINAILEAAEQLGQDRAVERRWQSEPDFRTSYRHFQALTASQVSSFAQTSFRPINYQGHASHAEPVEPRLMPLAMLASIDSNRQAARASDVSDAQSLRPSGQRRLPSFADLHDPSQAEASLPDILLDILRRRRTQ